MNAPPRPSDTARTAVFQAPGRPHTWIDVPLPREAELRPGERLVALRCATVCGSDLHTITGRRQEPTPCVLGHEGIGVIVRTAADQREWLGRRVTWSSSVGCGRVGCAPCTEHDLPQKCSSVFKYGHVARADEGALAGTYATHLLLRSGTAVFELPDVIPDSAAAPINCALATMVAALEGSVPAGARTAVVQGAGLLGLFGAALLRARGVARVLVVDVDDRRLEHVEAFGGEPVLASARGHIADRSVDFVVEACGQHAVVAEGIELLRTGGAYVLAGLVHPGPTLAIDGESLLRRCLTLRGLHNYAPRHLQTAVAFLAQHAASMGLESVIRAPMPLAQIDEAIQLASTGRWQRVALSMDAAIA